jgi:antitoxin CptB
MAGAAQEIGRLRWRCRRGMKELDVLLTRYVDEHYAQASSEDQRPSGRSSKRPTP